MKKFAPMALLAALLLGGCATPFQVDDVNTVSGMSTPAAGTAFTKALFDEYKAATEFEAKVEVEWRDAAFFARKGLQAAGGAVVLPETVSDWCIPDGRVAELTDARTRLMGYLDGGARERLPAIAAKAQASFDCWVEEEHEGETGSTCQADFLAAEAKLKQPAPVAAPAKPKIVKTFVVYFDLGKSTITNASRKVLDEVTKAQADIKPTNIYLAGHTDTVGSASYNQALSQRRATAVADALGARGVKATMLDVKAFGQEKLAVPTANNVKEAKNRRVEIYFEK